MLKQLLWAEVLLKGGVGLALLLAPVYSIALAGFPSAGNGFWPRLTGAILLGIAAALLLQGMFPTVQNDIAGRADRHKSCRRRRSHRDAGARQGCADAPGQSTFVAHGDRIGDVEPGRDRLRLKLDPASWLARALLLLPPTASKRDATRNQSMAGYSTGLETSSSRAFTAFEARSERAARALDTTSVASHLALQFEIVPRPRRVRCPRS